MNETVGGVASEKALGKRLQDVRRSKGLTQQALCHEANLSYSTLAKIERGAIKAPSIFTIQSIALALNIGLDELLGGAALGPSQPRQRTKSGVSFIYFDLNDTLVRAAQAGFIKLAHDTGVAADIIETLFWHYNDRVCRGTESMSDFDAALAKRLGKPVNWAQIYLEAAEPIPEMQDLLRWAAQHYQVGLMTNIMPGLLAGLRQRGLLPDVTYAAIIDSSEVGAIKPEPKFYEIARDRAGVPANEILTIDDTRSLLAPAEAQGWHVAWFDSYRAADSAEHLRKALEPAG